jgi:hypothetical protein
VSCLNEPTNDEETELVRRNWSALSLQKQAIVFNAWFPSLPKVWALTQIIVSTSRCTWRCIDCLHVHLYRCKEVNGSTTPALLVNSMACAPKFSSINLWILFRYEWFEMPASMALDPQQSLKFRLEKRYWRFLGDGVQHAFLTPLQG